MRKFTTFMFVAGAAASLTLVGCQSGPTTAGDDSEIATTASPAQMDSHAPAFARPGYVTFEEDGRLWVFTADSEGLAEFTAHGEPAKSVTWIGAGPEGKTLKSDHADAMLGYIASKPGYRVFAEDGRLWVFQEGGEGLADFLAHGEPAKSVTWIGEGPRGATLKSDSADTLLQYLAAKPGFEVFVEDGRLWVFREGSADLAEFHKHGEPAKSVTRIGEGVRGTTIKSTDQATLLAYLAQ